MILAQSQAAARQRIDAEHFVRDDERRQGRTRDPVSKNGVTVVRSIPNRDDLGGKTYIDVVVMMKNGEIDRSLKAGIM